MARSTWPVLFVIVAVTVGAAGYYVGVCHSQNSGSTPLVSPSAETIVQLSGYNFTHDTAFPVSRVVDGDTVELKLHGSSERIRLIGLDAPEHVHPGKPDEFYSKESSLFLRNLLEGESVFVREGKMQFDKYNRRLAYIFRAPDGLFVNLEIVRQGYGCVCQVGEPFEHLDLFLHHEKNAINSKKGLWASECGIPITPKHARQRLGQKCMIEFVVNSVWDDQSRGYSFLNSELNHRDPSNFSVFVASVGVEKYRRIGIVPSVAFANKRIRVVGTITAYRGMPQIIVTDPTQVSLVDVP